MRVWFYLGRAIHWVSRGVNALSDVFNSWEAAFYRGVDGKQLIEDEDMDG